MAIETNTDGIVILTEFQKPVLNPSHFKPVHCSLQALTHGSKVTSTGGANKFPIRISGIPFSDVTIITYKGTA
jgi:hypothetical protein